MLYIRPYCPKPIQGPWIEYTVVYLMTPFLLTYNLYFSTCIYKFKEVEIFRMIFFFPTDLSLRIVVIYLFIYTKLVDKWVRRIQ